MNTQTIKTIPAEAFAKCEKCTLRFTCTVDPRGKRCDGPVLRIK